MSDRRSRAGRWPTKRVTTITSYVSQVIISPLGGGVKGGGPRAENGLSPTPMNEPVSAQVRPPPPTPAVTSQADGGVAIREHYHHSATVCFCRGLCL